MFACINEMHDAFRLTLQVAMAMAAKAKLLLRELKTVKADLAFAKDRCGQLEEENRILRESLENGDNPEDDDLVLLFLVVLYSSHYPSLLFLFLANFLVFGELFVHITVYPKITDLNFQNYFYNSVYVNTFLKQLIEFCINPSTENNFIFCCRTWLVCCLSFQF